MRRLRALFADPGLPALAAALAVAAFAFGAPAGTEEYHADGRPVVRGPAGRQRWPGVECEVGPILSGDGDFLGAGAVHQEDGNG